MPMKKIIVTIAAIAASNLVVSAQTATTVFSNDFSTGYTNGNLVGQNGWSQTTTNIQTVFQTVSNGVVVLPSGATGQDTWNAFSSAVSTTNAGNYLLTTINFSLTNAPNTTADYFFHLSSPTNTTSVFFQRLYSRSAVGGFELGINGASGATLVAWGSTVLSLNTRYQAVIKWEFVAGATNDLLSLYLDPLDPILTNNTVFASTNFTTTEPTTVAAANLRIGSAATTPGVLVDSIEVQVVPEPSTYALLALSAAGLGAHMIRRRRR